MADCAELQNRAENDAGEQREQHDAAGRLERDPFDVLGGTAQSGVGFC